MQQTHLVKIMYIELAKEWANVAMHPNLSLASLRSKGADSLEFIVGTFMAACPTCMRAALARQAMKVRSRTQAARHASARPVWAARTRAPRQSATQWAKLAISSALAGGTTRMTTSECQAVVRELCIEKCKTYCS